MIWFDFFLAFIASLSSISKLPAIFSFDIFDMQFSITEICLRRAFASRMVDTSTLGHVDIKVQSYNNNIMSNLTFSGYSVQITVFSAMSIYPVIETEVNLTNRGEKR